MWSIEPKWVEAKVRVIESGNYQSHNFWSDHQLFWKGPGGNWCSARYKPRKKLVWKNVMFSFGAWLMSLVDEHGWCAWLMSLVDEPGWWAWLMSLVDEPGWWAWLMNLVDEPGWWAWLMSLVDEPGWWAWLMSLVDGPGWWAWLMSLVDGSMLFIRPVLFTCSF